MLCTEKMKDTDGGRILKYKMHTCMLQYALHHTFAAHVTGLMMTHSPSKQAYSMIQNLHVVLT
jgi:hypothetical protein